MKNRSKIGNRLGNPAYRTPTFFRLKKFSQSKKSKIINKKYGR